MSQTRELAEFLVGLSGRVEDRLLAIATDAVLDTVGAMVYGAYGISRLISLALDGMPSTSLVGALVIELVIAALCLLALARPEPWPEKSPEIEGMTASA